MSINPLAKFVAGAAAALAVIVPATVGEARSSHRSTTSAAAATR